MKVDEQRKALKAHNVQPIDQLSPIGLSVYQKDYKEFLLEKEKPIELKPTTQISEETKSIHKSFYKSLSEKEKNQQWISKTAQLKKLMDEEAKKVLVQKRIQEFKEAQEHVQQTKKTSLINKHISQ